MSLRDFRILDGGTVVEVHEWGTQITLPSGSVVPGEPHDTDDYRATAERLGYGDDVAAMCRHHDALHAWLAEALGLPASLSLQDAAGELPPEQKHLADLEEIAILAIQELLRRSGSPMPWRGV